MSFKFPIFKDLSFFDTFFKKPDDNSITTDTDAFIMSLDINKYAYSHEIGYINNFRNKCMRETGSYILIINSKNGSGPNAIYCISKSDKSKAGNIKELIKTNGILNDSLELDWNPHEYPVLKLKTNNLRYNNKEKILYFSVKVITSF